MQPFGEQIIKHEVEKLYVQATQLAHRRKYYDLLTRSTLLVCTKAELLQLNQTQFPSLGIFVNKKVGNRKN